MPDDLDARLERIRDLLETDPTATHPLTSLAALVGLSPGHLQRTFTAKFALSPKAWQRICREKALKSALRLGQDVTGAVYHAGYGSGSRVYEKAHQRLGMTPGQYAQGGAGVAVSYGCAPTSLGQVLVAATDQGICAVFLGDDAAPLVAALTAEFPRARITPMPSTGTSQLRSWLEWVLGEIAGKTPLGVPPPLDPGGSPFQQQVWELLRTIPAGETRTYAQIAQAMGRPTASRAVARACATNRISLLIPCHRVIRGDGTLSGYRWGVARKAALLAKEQRAKPGPSALPT